MLLFKLASTLFFKITATLSAALVSVVGSVFTPVTVDKPSPPEDICVSQSITVMNFNVYVFGTGEKSPESRTEAVAETIRKQAPDSFGVEEADEGWVERLSAALPEYAHAGHGRDEGGTGEASPVFYLKDKYELVSEETFWLSPTPDKPSREWDAWLNRICTVAVLKDKATGFTYAHFNAHFDNIGSISRNESVAVVSKKISEYNLPTVFTGDLNGKEGSVMYNRILESGMIDTKYLALESDSGATYHGYANLDAVNNKPIDFIFVNGCVNSVSSYKVIRDKINGIYPSDHYPVVSKLNMTYGKDDSSVRIMSFNLLCGGSGELTWEKRASSVVSLIKEVRPDSFGVQEAHKNWIDTLVKGLPEYSYAGVGRENGKTDGEYSAVFYLNDKYDVAQSETFWLSETPDKPSTGWDGACRRICTWAKLVNKESGEAYIHMNTHLDHRGATAQVEGAKLIRDKADSFKDIPVVCTGDFNVLQDSECYKIVTEGCLMDSKKLAADTMDSGTYHGFEPEKVSDVIDFVFVNGSVKPLTYRVINQKMNGKFYSDHYAVYADVEIK